jgi:protein-S-isoprenylcysteine O-methyltransferase Ste14
MTRFFDWFQLGVLVCLLFLGFGRALLLRGRGIRVLVLDRPRAAVDAIRDLLFAVCVTLWVYEIFAYTVPLSVHIVPETLSPIIIDNLVFKVLGMVMSLAGFLIYGLALRELGESWRIGIDTERTGPLVTDGPFAWTRNPIYVALDLVALGAFLIMGRLVFLVLALIIVCTFDRQIRKEESFLIQAFGQSYKEYRDRVGRYLTFRER